MLRQGRENSSSGCPPLHHPIPPPPLPHTPYLRPHPGRHTSTSMSVTPPGHPSASSNAPGSSALGDPRLLLTLKKTRMSMSVTPMMYSCHTRLRALVTYSLPRDTAQRESTGSLSAGVSVNGREIRPGPHASESVEGVEMVVRWKKARSLASVFARLGRALPVCACVNGGEESARCSSGTPDPVEVA